LPVDVIYGRPPSPSGPPPPGGPPACRIPETCDLPARLATVESQLSDIKTLLVSLLAEERRRDAAAAAPLPTAKAG
jgi:hypothetical protein